VTLLRQLILIEQNLQKSKEKLQNDRTRKSQAVPVSQSDLSNHLSFDSSSFRHGFHAMQNKKKLF